MGIVEYFRAAADMSEGFPLTTFQAEALFPCAGARLYPSLVLSDSFRVEVSWEVVGLDVDRLRRAAMSVVCRHEALRSTFDRTGAVMCQRSAPAVATDEFFHLLDPADSLEAAVEAGVPLITSIPVDGPSPFRVVVVPFDGRHCVFVAIHHFFADIDGLHVAVRDLWSAYSSGDFVTEPSGAYSDLCIEAAQIYRDEAALARLREFWSTASSPPDSIEIEAPKEPNLSLRPVQGKAALADGGARLNQFARQHGILPVAVLLTAAVDALRPWFAGLDQVTLNLVIGGSRLDRRLSSEVLCAVMHRPVTFGPKVLAGETNAGRCKAATASVLNMLRHAAVPPAALIDGYPGYAGAVLVNVFSDGYNQPGELPGLPQMTVLPPLRTDKQFDEDVLLEAFQFDTKGLALTIVVGDQTLSIGHLRVGVDFSTCDPVSEQFSDALTDLMAPVTRVKENISHVLSGLGYVAPHSVGANWNA